MYVEKSGLKIARELAAFLDDKVLPATGIDPSKFWTGVADIFERFTPENKALLAKRDQLQTKIDAWHQSRVGHPIDAKAEQKFLTEIGYLVDEPSTFAITSKNIDPEISDIAGPQLVVPVLNARFVLNAANARWGSLYDALYGTDVIPGKAEGKGYNSKRGQKVIAWSKAFLDRTAPIVQGSHSEVSQYVVIEGQLQPTLKDASQFAGYRGEASNPSTILLKNSGLHIEIDIDRGHTIGRDDLAGIADIKLEAALSTIVDMEDSVAAVDAEDKVEAYSNWSGLMQGDLEAQFQKGGHVVKRSMNSDRNYVAPDGSDLTLTGRSLLLVRNVGHLMTTPAVLMPDGSEAFEGILDGIVTSLISLCDLDRKGEYVNSRAGSIYIVKPKMHGPEEVGFANRLFAAVENLLGLDQDTIKIGVMDEERRTSANLTACIKEVAGRIFFINTGFLDRTGDEIHTVMQAGPVVLKENMKNTPWIGAYEDRNVQIGLACGFTGKAQIGKGMWAAPDRMAEMMEQKIAHPKTGANTAWVPSPTAATLHATHYHKVDVFAHRKRIETKPVPSLETLLTVPLAGPEKWSEADIIRCLENNIQSILGYVVRWIDQGIGCSKVPDYDDIGLMEDRATLRISSQHVANWLLHGVCTTDQVDAAFLRMAAKVDQQNAGDPVYRNLATQPDDSIAFQAAKALVFEGVSQPNGYTEPLLHAFRRKRKELDETGRE